MHDLINKVKEGQYGWNTEMSGGMKADRIRD